MRKTVLVAHGETFLRQAWGRALEAAGYRCVCVARLEEALEQLPRVVPAAIVAGADLPGGGGWALLQRAQDVAPGCPAVPVILASAQRDAASAVTAIRAGAEDFLDLPCPPEQVAERVGQALARTLAHQAGSATSVPTNGLVLADPAMVPVLELARLGADGNVVILLQGESGTGKEVLAQYIHRLAGRRGPLVAVNCAALPEALLESELFGHERGSFTGASQRRIGCFEAAGGGTILLDEISEIGLGLQAKLLRVLQEFEIRRVGSNHSLPVDVKVIATTNRDLAAMVRDGQFRRDLYYRLRVFPILLPPLRERPRDILPLAHHFIHKFAGLHGRAVAGLEAAAAAKLLQHGWPGNVRELEHVISRAVLLTGHGEVQRQQLLLEGELDEGVDSTPRNLPAVGEPRPDRSSAPGGSAGGVPSAIGGRPEGAGALADLLGGMTLAEVEQQLILGTLARCGGNRTHAAERLGISIRTLRNKIRGYRAAGLTVPSAPAGVAFEDDGEEPEAARVVTGGGASARPVKRERQPGAAVPAGRQLLPGGVRQDLPGCGLATGFGR